MWEKKKNKRDGKGDGRGVNDDPQRKAKSCQNNRRDRQQGKRNDNSEII
jgi:hypothetical protein